MGKMTLERACEVMKKLKHGGAEDWHPSRMGFEGFPVARSDSLTTWIGEGFAVVLAEHLERDSNSADAKAGEAIIDAIRGGIRDIQEWKQLGRRWMDESPDYGRDPKCPTDAGMKRSDDVILSLAQAMKAVRSIAGNTPASEPPSCSTPSPSTVVPPDRETWDILCAYLAGEEHHGSGISEGRLAEILEHRLGWCRDETQAAWYDAVARGNALIEQDHRRKAPLVQAEIERRKALATSSKAKSTGAPPSSSGGTGSEAG